MKLNGRRTVTRTADKPTRPTSTFLFRWYKASVRRMRRTSNALAAVERKTRHYILRPMTICVMRA